MKKCLGAILAVLLRIVPVVADEVAPPFTLPTIPGNPTVTAGGTTYCVNGSVGNDANTGLDCAANSLATITHGLAHLTVDGDTLQIKAKAADAIYAETVTITKDGNAAGWYTIEGVSGERPRISNIVVSASSNYIYLNNLTVVPNAANIGIQVKLDYAAGTSPDYVFLNDITVDGLTATTDSTTDCVRIGARNSAVSEWEVALTANAVSGTDHIHVDDYSKFVVGYQVSIQLDAGAGNTWHRTTVAALPGAPDQITLTDNMPSDASSGNAVYGSPALTPDITNVYMDDVEISECGDYGVVLYGGVDTFVFRNGSARDCGQDHADGDGISGRSNQGMIHHNTDLYVVNSDIYSNYEDGIDISAKTGDTVISKCKVYDNGGNGQGRGVVLWGSNNWMWNTLVAGNTGSAMETKPLWVYPAQTEARTYLLHNTLYNTADAFAALVRVTHHSGDNLSVDTDLYMYDNILSLVLAANTKAVLLTECRADGVDGDYYGDNNYWFTKDNTYDAVWQYTDDDANDDCGMAVKTTYSSADIDDGAGDWNADMGEDGNSFNKSVNDDGLADPGWINLGSYDFHLNSTSLAVDAGINVGITEDIDGDTRPGGAGYDIGAYEIPPTATVGYITIDGTGTGALTISGSGSGQITIGAP